MNKAILIWAVLATCASVTLRIRIDRCEEARAEAARKAEHWEGAYLELHRSWGEAERFYQAARKGEKP